MAGSQGSKARQRRSGSARESRERNWIFLASGAVLALVAVIVVAGLIVAWYMPPRALVLTVGSADFNASQVADRAVYLALTGNSNAQVQPADEGMNSLVRQQILLQVGQPMVGEVTEEDVRAAVAEQLGLAEGFDDEAYVSALADYLANVPITRSALEDIVRAGVVEERLTERFRGELPEAGDQAKIWAARTNDRALAQALVEAVRGGQGFVEAALETGVAETEEDLFDLGWYAPETLVERVQPAVSTLASGGITDPVNDADNVGFEVYFVEERTLDEPYEDAVRDRLAAEALDDFLVAQEEALQVERSVSSGERRWITQRVQARLAEAFGG